MDNVIFDDKKLSDVFRDIYKNTDTKREQINQFIIKLAKLVITPEDASLVAPIIKDFMEVSVKNDEHIVKVAQIAQRAISIGAKVSEMSDFLSDAEKAQILGNIQNEINSLQKDIEIIEDDYDSLESVGNKVNVTKPSKISTK